MEFRVYYGHDPALVPELRQAQLLILEPAGWSDEQLSELSAEGAELVGYVSPLAWADWKGPVKWWWGSKERDPEWSAWWLSLSSPGWRYSFRRMCIRALERTGGLFLDNLDRLQQDEASLKPLSEILADLKKKWSGARFLGNRGFAHLSQLRSQLDGILFENLTDRSFSSQDRSWVEEQLLNLQGLQVFALDYATRRDEEEGARLLSRFPRMHYYCAPDESLQSLT